MSCYYELGVENGKERLRADLEAGRIEGIQIDKTAPPWGPTDFCITDGTNFVWVVEPVEGGLGLKRWGGNDERPILRVLSSFYKTGVRDEGDLGIIHCG